MITNNTINNNSTIANDDAQISSLTNMTEGEIDQIVQGSSGFSSMTHHRLNKKNETIITVFKPLLLDKGKFKESIRLVPKYKNIWFNDTTEFIKNNKLPGRYVYSFKHYYLTAQQVNKLDNTVKKIYTLYSMLGDKVGLGKDESHNIQARALSASLNISPSIYTYRLVSMLWGLSLKIDDGKSNNIQTLDFSNLQPICMESRSYPFWTAFQDFLKRHIQEEKMTNPNYNVNEDLFSLSSNKCIRIESQAARGGANTNTFHISVSRIDSENYAKAKTESGLALNDSIVIPDIEKYDLFAEECPDPLMYPEHYIESFKLLYTKFTINPSLTGVPKIKELIYDILKDLKIPSSEHQSATVNTALNSVSNNMDVAF